MITENKMGVEITLDGYSFKPDDFEKIPKDYVHKSYLSEPIVLWKSILKTFYANKPAFISLILFIAIMLFAFAGPHFVPYTYSQTIHGQEYLQPSAAHLFGTDGLGRDMLVRVMSGTQISLLVGIFTSVMVLIIGATYGAIAGYCGGKVDNVMMRFLDIVYSIPTQLVVVLFTVTLSVPISALFETMPDSFFAKLGPGMVSIFIVFALLYWPGMARIVRSSIIQNKGKEYVSAALTMGASGSYVIRKHLIPNGLSIIIVSCTQQIRDAIFAEAFLSFIGMGIVAPMASLGSLVNDARTDMQMYPFLMIIPVVMIFIITLSLYMMGDGIRDAFDPHMQH